MTYQKIALTTGDADGIGLEVACKALQAVGPQKNTLFFLFRASDAPESLLKKIDKKFERIVVDDLKQAFTFFSLMEKKGDLSQKIIIDIASTASPAHWVEQAAKACHKKQLAAMVTGPISKTCIKAAGFKDLGHTDILKRVSGVSAVHMGFIGKEFNVVLTTAHIPLREVPKKLNFKILCEALINANILRLSLPNAAKKPIAVLGLNPHAGEEGLIGGEESALFPNLIQFAKEENIPMRGPYVPDAAFLKKNWKAHSVFLALYHDQGLIPFKAIHGQDSGVHVSLGLPFVRTSVDHGTAKDIFGKNVANPHSMIDAIHWGVKLARRQ